MSYLFVLISEFFFLNNVAGYIDPNIGAAIAAMIIGLLAGIGMTLKMYWHKLKYKLSTTKNSKNDV